MTHAGFLPLACADEFFVNLERKIVMQNPFSVLPQNASLDAICGLAGRVLEKRKAENRYTDFNTEIWYLAGDAMDRGFAAVIGMTKEQVAREMGNAISKYIERRGGPR